MSGEDFASHPLVRTLRSAYREFRAGEPRTALSLLEPVLVDSERANLPSVVAGAMWGLAGDCYFRLGETERGFAAYRRSIDLDPNAGCLALFARQVARHQRVEDAGLALRCLDVAGRADRRAMGSHPLHFLRFALRPGELVFRFVVVPVTRWRLRRLAAR